MIKHIDINVKKIIDENKYNKKIKQYSNKHNWGSNKIYSSVNNNNDLEKYLNFAKNTINYYEKSFTYKLAHEDIKEMEQAVANYEDALAKVLQCYDNPNCDFTYSAEELQELINYIDKFSTSISNVWMRKVCQD